MLVTMSPTLSKTKSEWLAVVWQLLGQFQTYQFRSNQNLLWIPIGQKLFGWIWFLLQKCRNYIRNKFSPPPSSGKKETCQWKLLLLPILPAVMTFLVHRPVISSQANNISSTLWSYLTSIDRKTGCHGISCDKKVLPPNNICYLLCHWIRRPVVGGWGPLFTCILLRLLYRSPKSWVIRFPFSYSYY